MHGYRSDEPLHEELAREGEDDGIEGYEGEVLRSLAILCRVPDVRGEGVRTLGERGVGVGEEDGVVQRVALAGVDEVGGKQDGEEGEREDPCVLQAEPFVPPYSIFGFLALAASLSALWGVVRLEGEMSACDCMCWSLLLNAASLPRVCRVAPS